MSKKRLSTLSLLEEILKYLNEHKIKEATLSIQDKVISINLIEPEKNNKSSISNDYQVSKNDEKLLQMFRNPPKLGKIEFPLNRSEIWKNIIEKDYESADRF